MKSVSVNKKKALETLEESVSLTDAVNILIPVIVYENAPYELLERSLNALSEKDYQLVVDAYIEDSLNAEPMISELNDEEIDGGMGEPAFVSLITSLVKNGYAEMDLSKIKSEKKRTSWEENLADDPYHYKDFDNEIVEKWFEIFDVK